MSQNLCDIIIDADFNCHSHSSMPGVENTEHRADVQLVCTSSSVSVININTHSSDPPESPGRFQPSQPSPDFLDLLAAQSFMRKTQETFKALNQKEKKDHYGV